MRRSYIAVGCVLAALTALQFAIDAPGGAGAAATRTARRAVHGVVVTQSGDPLPGVTFAPAGGVAPETNAFGEFCWLTADTAHRTVVARRAGFADETVSLPAGADDVELLVCMRVAGARRAPGMHRFFVVDALARGVADAEVTVTARGSGAELFRGRSSVDGAIVWPGVPASAPAYDLRAVLPGGADSVRPGLRLLDDNEIPISDATAVRDPLEVTFGGPRAPADGADADVLDATQRTVLRRRIADGSIQGLVPRAERHWIHVDDGSTAILRSVGPNAGWNEVLDVSARCTALVAAATDELVLAAPVLVPAFGEPRIVRGDSLSDVQGGAAARVPTVPLRRVGELLRTPLLDLEARSLCLRPARRDADVRVLADLRGVLDVSDCADRCLDDVRVVRGAATVTVRLTAEPPSGCAFYVTLARRGGSFAETRLMRSGEESTWTELCAGAFLVTVERRSDAAPAARAAGPRVQVFDDVRRVLVAPGSHATADVRIVCDDVSGVVRSFRR